MNNMTFIDNHGQQFIVIWSQLCCDNILFAHVSLVLCISWFSQKNLYLYVMLFSQLLGLMEKSFMVGLFILPLCSLFYSSSEDGRHWVFSHDQSKQSMFVYEPHYKVPSTQDQEICIFVYIVYLLLFHAKCVILSRTND